MDIRTREAVRYLGYGYHAIDERTLELIQQSFQELDECSSERFVYRIFEIFIDEQNKIYLNYLVVNSEDLCQNLEGCNEVVLFAATLGPEVERLIRKYTIKDMSKAVVMQACAAAKLEEYCDQIQAQLGYMKMRFSPGYGDFSLEYQKEILALLEAPKKIGLSMTEGSMLVPTKSVTAVIGIGNIDEKCHRKGCELCKKVDCTFRRR